MRQALILRYISPGDYRPDTCWPIGVEHGDEEYGQKFDRAAEYPQVFDRDGYR